MFVEVERRSVFLMNSFPSGGQVQLENRAIPHVRYVLDPWASFHGSSHDSRTVSGAAPVGAPLVRAVYNKLKSVGADALVLQG
jgi:hypothetical protein